MSDARSNNEAGEFSEQLTKGQTEITPEINSSVNISSSLSGSAESMKGDRPAHPRGMGPRTEGGKRRSSQNSIKYGIFSTVILLKGESRKKYESLLR